MKIIVPLSAALALSACAAVGPDYATPSVSLTERFAFDGGQQLQAAAYDTWWTALGDPLLNDFMRQGLESNLDIRTARARLAESAAQVRAQGVAAAQVSGAAQASAARTLTDDGTVGSEQGTVDGSFAFDLFGRFTRSRQRALAEYQATAFQAGQVRLAYQADLADAVIQARFFQAAIRATERTIESRRRILNLTDQLLEQGQLTRNDLIRARADLAQAQAGLPNLRNGLATSAIRVATLLDRPVAPILAAITASGASQPLPAHIYAAGVPADLLRNRPDILAAERRLAASYAAIGVATAELYPSLRLDGTIRVDGDNTFTLGPALALPLLSRNRLLAARQATRARAVQAEFDWRSQIRTAVGDVERALVAIDAARDEIAALQRALTEYRTLLDLSRETFQIGSTTLLELLDAEQEITRADLALASARRDLAAGAANLATATGRGYAVGLREVVPEPSTVAVALPDS